jgi:putative DNA primase/helicase
MAHVKDILAQLKKVKNIGPSKWSALCPAHEDKKPSLSIGLGDDAKVLLHCHAGCEVKDIVAAIGLTEADLFCTPPAPTASPTIVATYDYTDVDGKLLYQVIRRSDKSFLQRRPDGRGGWIWNMQDTPRVLYNLPGVVAAPVEDWLFVVEGEKDVNNLRALNIMATTNSGGAGKWHQIADDSVLHRRKIAIIPDNDVPGREHAQQVASALHGKAKAVKVIELPGLPEKGDVSDWLTQFAPEDTAGPGAALHELAAQAIEFVPGRVSVSSSEWLDPQPIPDDLSAVRPFDVGLLPTTIRPWVADIADRMQCPVDFPAVAAMVGMAGLVGRKVGIRPKQKDSWTVVPNLWGMLIGRPSMMKSPPLKEALRPIRQMTQAALEEHQKAYLEFLAEKELHEIQAAGARKDIAAALKKDDADVTHLQEELKRHLQPAPPKRRRYTVNDATVEKLGEILSENPNGVILERDELMGFLKSLERPGQEGARAFYLEAWTGDGEFETDRIGRGNVRIDRVCLSIIGTIQPGPLGLYLHEAIRGGTGDDGLMQRFQLAVWPDDPGPWQVVDRAPDADARNAAFKVFQRLDEMNGDTVGAKVDMFDDSGVPFLKFTPAAQQRFYEWMQTRENRLRGGQEHPAVESHLTKYRSLIPSLALLTHLAEDRAGNVGADAMERAIGWSDYLESHARRIYSQGVEPAAASARALAKRIQKGEVADGFTLRDIYRNHWSMLGDKPAVEMATALLVELDWLRQQQMPTGGMPKLVFHINPKARTARA